MSSTTIPYSLGFSIQEHPLQPGDIITVAFATTLARITCNENGSYHLETQSPNDIKRPGLNACSGIFADLAIEKSLGVERQSIPAWRRELSADALDQCLSAIGGMTVNTLDFHRQCAQRDGTASPVPVIEEREMLVRDPQAQPQR